MKHCVRFISPRLGKPESHKMSSSSLNGYKGWSREELIERITLLESRKDRPAVNPQPVIQQKEFSFSSHPRRKIALKFSYSGWEYGGLAFQLGPTPLPTVEGVLFDALAKARLIDQEAGFEGCGWEKCGRTDRGVSAAGQVVSLWVRSALLAEHNDNLELAETTMPTVSTSSQDQAPTSEYQITDAEDDFGSLDISSTPSPSEATASKPTFEHDYLSILNRLLPDTIRVLAWSPVASAFSARFSCLYRHYKYFFSPLGLDIPRMQQAALRLVGDHDFRNLCKLDPQKQITIFRRKVMTAEIEPLENGEGVYVFNLVGTAFLYHQVRHIMAILFLVGTGLEPPSVLSSLLNVEAGVEPTKDGDSPYEVVDRKPEYQMADALPLMLWECGYPETEVSWRTTGKPDDDGPAQGGTLYHQMQSIHSRSQIYTTLNLHFLAAASIHHPPPPSVFPVSDVNLLPREAMNIPLGGGTFKRSNNYTPLLKRNRLDTVEVMNERWRTGKGFRRDERRKAAEGGPVPDDEDE